jgi:hypothetical protein
VNSISNSTARDRSNLLNKNPRSAFTRGKRESGATHLSHVRYPNGHGTPFAQRVHDAAGSLRVPELTAARFTIIEGTIMTYQLINTARKAIGILIAMAISAGLLYKGFTFEDPTNSMLIPVMYGLAGIVLVCAAFSVAAGEPAEA